MTYIAEYTHKVLISLIAISLIIAINLVYFLLVAYYFVATIYGLTGYFAERQSDIFYAKSWYLFLLTSLVFGLRNTNYRSVKLVLHERFFKAALLSIICLLILALVCLPILLTGLISPYAAWLIGTTALICFDIGISKII